MANVLHKTTLQYLESVNTPDYPSVDWVINPDISAVLNVPHKYWKLSGTNVVEMTLAEKSAVDAAELQARKDKITEIENADMREIFIALIKVLNTKLPANKQITKQELIDAIKLEIQ